MDDVVLSVVKNRHWKDLDVYALSLVKSGFKGRKVMFVEYVPKDAIENLKALGFEVIPFSTEDQYQHLHFQSYRYYVAANWLSFHRSELLYVMWTDVCDLVFQDDFIPHLAQSEFTAAKEGRLMSAGGGQGWNEIWVRKFLPPSLDISELLKEEVLCSGSIGGRSEGMYILFTDIWWVLKQWGEMRGIDQGAFNYIARQSPYKQHTRIPEMSEGFVSTCGMFMAENNHHEWTVPPPYLDREEGLVRVSEGGKPFAIAHCYDRTGGFLNPYGDFRAILEKRYRERS